jgi:hypothetical protein
MGQNVAFWNSLLTNRQSARMIQLAVLPAIPYPGVRHRQWRGAKPWEQKYPHPNG